MALTEQKKRLLEDLRGRISSIEHMSEDCSPSENSAICAVGNLEKAQLAVSVDESQDAFRRIVRLGSSRYRSEKYFRNRLIDEGFSIDSIDDAIRRAKSCLVIDDCRFADLLIRSRINAGRGVAGIEHDLRSEGIDPTFVSGWPHEYLNTDFESQLERALNVLRDRPTRAKNVQAAAYRKLMSKGFGSDIATKASREYARELQFE